MSTLDDNVSGLHPRWAYTPFHRVPEIGSASLRNVTMIDRFESRVAVVVVRLAAAEVSRAFNDDY